MDRRRLKSRAEGRMAIFTGWKTGTTYNGAIPRSVTCHPSIARGRSCDELLRSLALNHPRKLGKTR